MRTDTQKLDGAVQYAKTLHHDKNLTEFEKWNQLIGYLDHLTEEKIL